MIDVNKPLTQGQASVEHGFSLSRAAGRTYNETTQAASFLCRGTEKGGTVPVSPPLAQGVFFF